METFTFQEINDAFEHLQGYAEQYQHKDLQNELAQIAITEDCKIAIVTNKNVDKTTFIEAFGKEIPPESNLSDADIALFIFDYEQLDANLSDDEQWLEIQERVAKDKDFEVLFVLDKIDKALNNTETKDWFNNKRKAADKLKNAAIGRGIQNPQIYPISSRYYFLENKGKNDDEYEELEDVKEKFTRYADGKGEGQLIEYIGIEKFKKDMQEHIAEKPKRRLSELASRIQKMIDDERKRVNEELTSLQHYDEDDLQERIRKLEERRKSIEESLEESREETKAMPKKREELENRLEEIAAFYLGKMEKLVDMHIQKDMLNPIDEMTKKTLAFVEHYSAGHNKMLSKLYAKTNAAKITVEKKNIFRLAGLSKLPEEMEEESETEKVLDKWGTEVHDKLNDIRTKIHDVIQEMLIDCKNNYTNVHDEMREIYKEIDSKLSSSIEISNNALEKTREEKSTAKWWNPTTWFDSKKVEEHTMIINGIKPEIDIDSILSFDIEISGSFIPKSESFDVKTSDGILKYHFENPYEEVSTGSLLNPFTWGDSKLEKTRDEEHFIVINGIKLKNAIEQKVLENIEKLKNAEFQNYKDNIEQIRENIKEFPRVSNTANKEQIDKLSLEIKEIDKQLDDINKQKAKKEKERAEQQTRLKDQLKGLNANPLCQTQT